MNSTGKYANFVIEFLKAHLTRKDIPVIATLCVTQRCNLNCAYCYEENYKKNHREFSTVEMLSLIDELCEMGTKLISLNGGEALLRDDIGIVVDKIRKKNILCQLTTNGLLVKKKIDVIKKIDALCLSIDGARECNDLNRGRGTYDKIIEGIECLKANNITFHTNTVLTKSNKKAVEEVMELACKYCFKTQFSTLRAEDSPDKTLGLNDEELKEIIKKILDYKKSGKPIFSSYETYKNVLNWPFSYDRLTIFDEIPEEYKPIKCYNKRFSCHIESDGSVYPCVVLVNKFKSLNVHEVGLRKAWGNLSNNKCNACYNICCNDLNLTFGLKPRPIWNAVKIVMGRIATRIK